MVRQRLSLYADDVALFIKPVEEELLLSKDILQIFGKASSLETNLQNSNVAPIRCNDILPKVITETLPCTVAEFPCTYLVFPLSHKKLRKADLMPWIKKIVDKLPGWKAGLMNKARRATLVHFVRSTVPVYLLIAMNVPKSFIKAVEKNTKRLLVTGKGEG